MTQLTCGTITLVQGLIATDREGLTLAGPGRDVLTISGGGVSRVFYAGSYANSVFTVRDLKIAHGHEEPEFLERAACLSGGTGALVLERVDVTDCHSYFSPSFGVHSGGAVAANVLTMIDSTITDSSVHEEGGSYAQGGGAWAAQAILIRSTISGNSATGQTNGQYAGGGGLWASNLVLVDSVISGNTTVATDPGEFTVGGGVVAYQNATILRSLIANNVADGDGGGLFKGPVELPVAPHSRSRIPPLPAIIPVAPVGRCWPAGHRRSPTARSPATPARRSAVRLDLLAGSTFTGTTCTSAAGRTSRARSLPAICPDQRPDHAGYSIDAPVAVFGSHDFIGDADPAITLPPDTQRGDPLLGPLADHGGQSATIALETGSRVIDAGANALSFVVDQRGPGFPRVVGAAADIGAYEVQPPPAPGSIQQSIRSIRSYRPSRADGVARHELRRRRFARHAAHGRGHGAG
ncbi:MAG: right-handed parallel beta-helix repeat-containing protein [Lysobacterales bacterium]